MSCSSSSSTSLDIPYLKLREWLISRHQLPSNYAVLLKGAKHSLEEALQGEYGYLLPGSARQRAASSSGGGRLEDKKVEEYIKESAIWKGGEFGYVEVTQIVKMLKNGIEGEKRGLLFNQYTSEHIARWRRIEKLYKYRHIYVVEVHNRLVQQVRYDLPFLRKNLAQLRKLSSELDRKTDHRLFTEQQAKVQAKFLSFCQKYHLQFPLPSYASLMTTFVDKDDDVVDKDDDKVLLFPMASVAVCQECAAAQEVSSVPGLGSLVGSFEEKLGKFFKKERSRLYDEMRKTLLGQRRRRRRRHRRCRPDEDEDDEPVLLTKVIEWYTRIKQTASSGLLTKGEQDFLVLPLFLTNEQDDDVALDDPICSPLIQSLSKSDLDEKEKEEKEENAAATSSLSYGRGGGGLLALRAVRALLIDELSELLAFLLQRISPQPVQIHDLDQAGAQMETRDDDDDDDDDDDAATFPRACKQIDDDDDHASLSQSERTTTFGLSSSQLWSAAVRLRRVCHQLTEPETLDVFQLSRVRRQRVVKEAVQLVWECVKVGYNYEKSKEKAARVLTQLSGLEKETQRILDDAKTWKAVCEDAVEKMMGKRTRLIGM